MIDRFLRDSVNLLIYGGTFIGLCAACITALTFELAGVAAENFQYILLIGTATAALYSLHRIVGLQKTAHLVTTDRFAIIRKYHVHIRIYTVLWVMLSAWFAIPFINLEFILWTIPGGLIAIAYVIPFLPGGRRLRDLGWGKILMIGWSWAWLTSAIPMGYVLHASVQMIIIHSLERMFFIILITIPFEIRDLNVDKSFGLITIPEKLGSKRTLIVAWILTGLTILLSFAGAFHYFNLAYSLAMTMASLITIPLLKMSYKIHDDYFFVGVIDGIMILALWFFVIIHLWI